MGRLKRVGISRFEGIENAYILVSARWRNEERDSVKATMSFLYDGGKFAAEWEPEYGPIQIWEKADGPGDGIGEHYFYDYVVDTTLNWSQLAVDREGLKKYFLDGNYHLIFAVLKEWANR